MKTSIVKIYLLKPNEITCGECGQLFHQTMFSVGDSVICPLCNKVSRTKSEFGGVK